MVRGLMLAAAGAAALAFAPVGAASAAETVTLEQVAGLGKGFVQTYEAGKKVYYVAPYRVYRPRVYVAPVYPVYKYKVKRKVYVY